MNLRFAISNFVSLLLVGLCWLPAEGKSYKPQNSESNRLPISDRLTPQELLSRSLDQAGQGDIGVALLKAKDAKSLANLNGSSSSTFIVDYLNTLLSIIEMADDNQRAAVINEAIATCDALNGHSDFSGSGNPESAYYFMLAVNRLADAALPLSEPTFIAL